VAVPQLLSVRGRVAGNWRPTYLFTRQDFKDQLISDDGNAKDMVEQLFRSAVIKHKAVLHSRCLYTGGAEFDLDQDMNRLPCMASVSAI
jgi:hypothetical protein